MSNPKRKEIVILLLFLLIGFALRFYAFDKKSLWLDEIHTYNDSRVNFPDQIKFYKEKPTYLHPPLFFVLTHFLYPFTYPERDLRIIPLLFGTFSILLIYLLASQFSASIALPCSLSLTFMVYHISLSQEGRFYSMLLFFGIASLYFFMKYLECLRWRYLFLAALCFAVMFYTSYSSIPFIFLSQLLWLYRKEGRNKKHPILPFFFLNGLILLFCLPWILFLGFNFKGQPFITDSLRTLELDSLWNTLYGVFHDWLPHAPLVIVSAILLILFPFLSVERKNAIILLAIILLPIGGLHFYCKLNKISHFITSRYFISFLPLFLITLYLSVREFENKFIKLKRFFRLELLFVFLFVVSNLVDLRIYYRSEKQDFRGLATYLKGNIQDGDKIIVGSLGYIPGLLYYFGVPPQGRLYMLSTRKVSENEVEYTASLIMGGNKLIISYSNTHWIKYAEEGNRLWIVVDKETAKEAKKISSCDFKGFFDGSFLNLDKFPTDASMYLFLWDPKSPGERWIDMDIE